MGASQGWSVHTMLMRAVALAEEHRVGVDGEINLTALEEEIRVEFEVPDREWDDLDMSFKIWDTLDKKGII